MSPTHKRRYGGCKSDESTGSYQLSLVVENEPSSEGCSDTHCQCVQIMCQESRNQGLESITSSKSTRL